MGRDLTAAQTRKNWKDYLKIIQRLADNKSYDLLKQILNIKLSIIIIDQFLLSYYSGP